MPNCCKCEKDGYYYCPDCLKALHDRIDKDLEEMDKKHQNLIHNITENSI